MVQLDRWLRLWVVTHRLAVLDPLMWFISVIGRGGLVWLVAGATLVLTRRLRIPALVQLVLSVLLASTMANQVVKPLVARERPFVSTPQIRVIGGQPDDASFPSGHAANAFAGAAVLSWAAPEARIVWWALAVAVAYSRVYLGVHYPLDVLGGALVGLLSAVAIVKLTSFVRPRSAGSI